MNNELSTLFIIENLNSVQHICALYRQTRKTLPFAH
jgi:hypothetical protein